MQTSYRACPLRPTRSLSGWLIMLAANGDMVSAGRLPNFLIIGAMKSGTTSLYHYLREHPQVYLPPFKAPEFFASERRSLDWYRGLFADAPSPAIACGEASNVYTKFPVYQGVPERIHALIPDCRMIYLVRDPVARIRSHYRTRVADGAERSPIDKAVRTNHIYLDYTRYAMQLDRYLEHFRREQLLVLKAEDLRDRRLDTMRRVFAFLGVDATFEPPSIERAFYRTDDRAVRSPVPHWLRKSLKRYVPAAKRAKELENNVLGALKRLRGTREKAIDIPPEVRAWIVDSLAPDVARLKGFLGRDFDAWGFPSPAETGTR